MRNLWHKERKRVFRELLQQYLEEGYSYKEAKKFASEETDEFCSMDEDFVNEIFSAEYED